MASGIRRTSTARRNRGRGSLPQPGWVDRNSVQFARRNTIEQKTVPTLTSTGLSDSR